MSKENEVKVQRVLVVDDEKSISEFLELFNNIQYVDPNVDYNLFCKINVDNEKRQSLSLFFVNLMINGVIKKERILSIIKIDNFWVLSVLYDI